MTIKTETYAKMYGELLRTKLQRLLPPYASCYLEGAFAGDEQQAFKICVAAPNEYRGLIAEAAYFLGVPNPGYQTIIRNVWEHDHKMVDVAGREQPCPGTPDDGDR
jgi:hypothetical protein